MKIFFSGEGKTVEAEKGANLLTAACQADIEIEHACGGVGMCGKCKVVLHGEAGPVSETERGLLLPSDIANGVRLACLVDVIGDIEVETERIVDDGCIVLENGTNLQKITTTGDRPAEKVHLVLSKPNLNDAASDAERIESAAGCPFDSRFSLGIYRKLPDVLTVSDYNITAIIANNVIIGIEAGNTTSVLYGAAVDIGTTTVVVSIVNLNTGEETASASAVNDQRYAGQEVISRIQYAAASEGLEEMRVAILKQINSLISEAISQLDAKINDIYTVGIGANTTMLHLLLGVCPGSIALSPYQSTFTSIAPIPATNVGIAVSESALLYLLPSVSSYVGGDIVSGVIATGMHRAKIPSMLIDIGTNGEIIFGSQNGFVACSCAAGPALEGMNISCGMLARKGAVESVCVENGDISLGVIGDVPPEGICGSGIVDAVAVLLDFGIISSSGRMRENITDETGCAGKSTSLAKRICPEGNLRFVLGHNTKGDEIYISQKDVRQVQLAKAAILSAIGVLLKELGVTFEKIEKVYIAGAFGRHLRLKNMVRIGIVPPEFKDKVIFVGNTSKSGAALAVMSSRAFAESETVRRMTKYFELSAYEGYENSFLDATAFQNIAKEVEK